MAEGVAARDQWLQALGLYAKRGWLPRITQLYGLPDDDASPHILFMTRVWEPFDHPERSREKAAERMQINEMRIDCIQQLRTEFRDRFVGGLAHTEFAMQHYRDFLIPDKALIPRKHYLELLKAFPICIATTGLHSSIGWKLAEYVAFSKAIVSEKLIYQVPGPFGAGDDYLEFETAEQCVESVHQLV